MTVSDIGFAFWAIFAVTLIGSLVVLAMEDAEGHTEVFDIQAGNADMPYSKGNNPHVAICPDGRFYVPFIDSDGDFNVAWSDDDRATWDEMTVQADGWKGETYMAISSIQTWVNNTTVILVRMEDADRDYDLYLFFLWGENDVSDPASWNYTQINTGGLHTITFPSMVFNRTGMLHIVWYEQLAIRRSTWDVTTGEGDLPPEVWKSITNSMPMLQCDYNNDVWLSYTISASFQGLVDWDDEVAMQVSRSVGRIQYSALFVASDNTKVLTGHYQYLATHQVVVAYETVTNTSMTYNLFQSDVDTWSNSYFTTGNIVGTTVSICLLRLETGSEEYVSYTAAYDAIDAVWEGSEKVLWNIPTDDDEARHFGTGPNSVWPKIDGTSVCMPTGGAMYYWMWKDEKGATDDYWEIVYSDGATFPTFIWSPPPTITTISLPDGTIDVFYSFTMSVTGGELPRVWSLILGPAWLDIGSANGTLHGTPLQTGTFVVKVRVRDNAARTDDGTFSLTINSAVSEPGGEDWNVDVDDFLGPLWLIFIVMCVCIAIMDKVHQISSKKTE